MGFRAVCPMSGDRLPVAFPSRLNTLTSLRFFLALGVVLFLLHLAWVYDDMAVTGLFERARLGVDVFFILSGFVLGHVYLREMETGNFRYRKFLGARVARIYPVHLLALFGMAAMVVAAELLGQEYRRQNFGLVDFIKTAFLVQSWFPAAHLNEWNGPSWSLSAEWFVYVLFPAFAWLGVRFRARPLLLLLIAVLLFAAFDRYYVWTLGKPLPHAEENLGILRIIPEFLAGIALYQWGRYLSPSRTAARWFALTTTVVFLAAMHFRLDDRAIVVLAGPLILSFALLSKAGSEGLLANPVLLLMGEASYALYLIHIPLFTAWRGIVSAMTGVSSSYRLELGEAAGMLTTSLLVSVLVYHWFERHARRWIGQRINGSTKRPPPIA